MENFGHGKDKYHINTHHIQLIMSHMYYYNNCIVTIELFAYHAKILH